jgi:hypothetical protein
MAFVFPELSTIKTSVELEKEHIIKKFIQNFLKF